MFMLDTNIVSSAARDPYGPVARKLADILVADIKISIVVSAEVRYGFVKNSPVRLRPAMEAILAEYEILPLFHPIDVIYADIRHARASAGKTVGPNDLLIAAHALSLDAVLVTDNTSEFSRVPGLAVENWLRQ